MLSCTACSSNNYVKNGKRNNRQRYICKDCNKAFYDKATEKYSHQFKMEVIEMYLNSVGIRAIARIKKIHNSVVSCWIKKASDIVRKQIDDEVSKLNIKQDIAIIEMDELCTYIKKNLTQSHQGKESGNGHLYGLLWNETQRKLLILK